MARPKGRPKKALTVYLPECMVDELRKRRGEISDLIEEALLFTYRALKEKRDEEVASKILEANGGVQNAAP